MILPFGSTGGLPDFVELSPILIVQGQPAFAVKCLHSWYSEHLRIVLDQQELPDSYPLAAYTVDKSNLSP